MAIANLDATNNLFATLPDNALAASTPRPRRFGVWAVI